MDIPQSLDHFRIAFQRSEPLGGKLIRVFEDRAVILQQQLDRAALLIRQLDRRLLLDGQSFQHERHYGLLRFPQGFLPGLGAQFGPLLKVLLVPAGIFREKGQFFAGAGHALPDLQNSPNKILFPRIQRPAPGAFVTIQIGVVAFPPLLDIARLRLARRDQRGLNAAHPGALCPLGADGGDQDAPPARQAGIPALKSGKSFRRLRGPFWTGGPGRPSLGQEQRSRQNEQTNAGYSSSRHSLRSPSPSRPASGLKGLPSKKIPRAGQLFGQPGQAEGQVLDRLLFLIPDQSGQLGKDGIIQREFCGIVSASLFQDLQP